MFHPKVSYFSDFGMGEDGEEGETEKDFHLFLFLFLFRFLSNKEIKKFTE